MVINDGMHTVGSLRQVSQCTEAEQVNWPLKARAPGDSCEKLTPAKFEAAAVCLLKSLKGGNTSQNLTQN